MHPALRRVSAGVGNAAVEKVDHDPALVAELLVLLRFMLGDEQPQARAVRAIQRIAAATSGADESEAAALAHEADMTAASMSLGQIIVGFRAADRLRRIRLAQLVAQSARQDPELIRYESTLMRRTLDILDLNEADIAQPGEMAAP